MSIDGPDQPSFPELPKAREDLEASGEKPEHKKRKRKSRGQSKGKTVIHSQGSSVESSPSLVTEQSSASKPPPQKPGHKRKVTGQRLTQSKLESVSTQLRAANKELDAFITRNNAALESIRLDCSINGFSQPTYQWMMLLDSLKALITERNRLLELVFNDVRQHASETRTVDQKVRSMQGQATAEANPLEALIQEKGIQGASAQAYWEQRATVNRLANYLFRLQEAIAAAITRDELTPYSGMSNCTQRLTEWIPVGLECMQVYRDCIECMTHLNKKKQVANAKEMYEKTGQLTLLNLEIAPGHFLQIGQPAQLRQLLISHPGVMSAWLSQLDLEHLSDGREPEPLELILPVLAAVILGEPSQAITFIPSISVRLKDGRFPPDAVGSLLRHLSKALAILIQSPKHKPGTSAHYREVKDVHSEASLLMQEVKPMVDWVRGIEDTSLYFKQVLPGYMKCMSQLKQLSVIVKDHEATVEKNAEALKAEIDAEKARSLRKRMRKKAEDNSDTHQGDTGTDKKTTAPAEAPAPQQATEQEFHPVIETAINLMSSSAPIEAIAQAISSAEREENLSNWDKANIRYCYADIVAHRLRKAVEALERHEPAIEQFKECIKDGSLPEVELDSQFCKALTAYEKGLKDVVFTFLRMRLEYDNIYKACTESADLDDELARQLINLHDEIKLLLERAEAIPKTCKELEQLYSERGKVLLKFGKTSSARSDRKQQLQEAIQGITKAKTNLDSQCKQMQVSLDKPAPTPPVNSAPTATAAAAAEPLPKLEQTSTFKALLPEALAKELGWKQEPDKSSKTLSPESLHPESQITPHPLSQLAQDLPQPLVVKADGQEWLVQPGLQPANTKDVLIPKSARRLTFDFTLPEQPSASSQTVEEVSEASSMELQLEPMIPEALCSAIHWRLRKSGKYWQMSSTGLVGQEKTVSTEDELVERQEVSEEELQACFCDYMQKLQAAGRKKSSAAVPEKLREVLQKAASNSLFDLSGCHTEMSLLADALNQPISVQYLHSAYLYNPGQAPHQKITGTGTIKKGISLHVIGGEWYASDEHYWSVYDE